MKEHLQSPAAFRVGEYEGVELAGIVSPTDGDGERYTACRLLVVDNMFYTFLFSCPVANRANRTSGKRFLESITLR